MVGPAALQSRWCWTIVKLLWRTSRQVSLQAVVGVRSFSTPDVTRAHKSSPFSLFTYSTFILLPPSSSLLYHLSAGGHHPQHRSPLRLRPLDITACLSQNNTTRLLYILEVARVLNTYNSRNNFTLYHSSRWSAASCSSALAVTTMTLRTTNQGILWRYRQQQPPLL